MNLICKLRGHTTEYRFVLQRFAVTVRGDAPSAAVVRLARLSESATPVREVCTRCDVITWEGPRPGDAVRQDHEGGSVSAPQPDPDSASAKFSDGVSVPFRLPKSPAGPAMGVKLCSGWVVRRGRDEECGAKILPEGGCPNAHKHMSMLEEIGARIDPPKEGDRCLWYKKTEIEVTSWGADRVQILDGREPCTGRLVEVTGGKLRCTNEDNHSG